MFEIRTAIGVVMRMPEKIDQILLAPCGVNCLACYRHLVQKKPCCGCLAGDDGKPDHCRSCAIKECCERQGLARCSECADFPCAENKRMERNYKRYGVSLVGNLSLVREEGISAFMDEERIKWRCSACGGVVSQHHQTCSECKAKAGL